MVGVAEVGVPVTSAVAPVPRTRGKLFRKYVALFVGVVFLALLGNGLFEIWFSYQDHEASLLRIESEQAQAAAAKIDGFVKEIQNQLGWTTQLPWSAATLEQHRFDALRLLRQVPAITELSQLDSTGRERLRVSRLATDVVDSQQDFSSEPKFKEAMAHKVWYGPVYFRRESEPYMTLAVAGARRDAGVSVAEVNLKLIWDVVSQIRIGERGQAFVVDAKGRLIAHPDISLVLRDTDLSQLPQVRAAREESPGGAANPLRAVRDLQGREVLSAHAVIAPLGWLVFVELPLDEANAPLYASIERTAALMLAGLALAFLAGLFLARRMVVPIRRLQESAERLGGGDLSQRIAIKTGDEIETLADRFNLMASRLQDSYATLEAKVEERTRDLQEALEYQTATSEVLNVISRSTSDLQPVFDTLLAAAVRLCGVEAGAVATRQGDHFRYVRTLGTTPEFDAALRGRDLIPDRSTVAGRVLLDKAVVYIPDLGAEQAYAFPKSPAHRSVLGVPLLREDEPLGVITLTRDTVEVFTERQIALVRTFADQAVIAIENTRLITETREALDQQTATAEVLGVINSSPGNLGPVFDAMLERALTLCEASFGFLNRYDGEKFVPAAQRGVPEALAAYFGPGIDQPRPGDAHWRLLEGEDLIHNLDQKDEDAYRSGNPLRRAVVDLGGARTALVVALRNNRKLLGALTIYRQEVRPFSEKQVALVQNFAAQAVIAMENARLISETREALDQQTATAEVLKVISRSAFDLDTILETLTRSALDLCNASQTALFLREGERLFCRAIAGTDAESVEYLRQQTVPVDEETYLGRAVLRGELGHVPDFVKDAHTKARSIQEHTGFRSLLTVPLLRQGEAIGALAITRPQVGAFSERLIEVARTFADQAVIAIENVRLFEEVQERTRELARSLEDLRAAQDRLIQSEKMASLGQLTAGIAHEIKNPLNFVNNFASLSTELLGELKELVASAMNTADAATRDELEDILETLSTNLAKIGEHGKRADGIVKSMLQHSRGGRGEVQETELNALVEEALALAYHGLRAQDKSFNITMEKALDPAVGKITAVPQDLTRVLLNLIGNGFYAANKRNRDGGDPAFSPVLKVSTKNLGDTVEIRIRDNGIGIPDEIRAKLFTPFFTTKPTGEGTGLGLSISYEIVTRGHGGSIAVESRVGEFTEFVVRLPRMLRQAPKNESKGQER